MDREWRCTRCEKLLGVVEGDRVHIHFARGHQYLVGAPAIAVCRGCQTVNEFMKRRGADGQASNTELGTKQ